MKWIIFVAILLAMSGCFVFGFERPLYRGDSIIVNNIDPQESKEVLYNLEHVEGFTELSCKVMVRFSVGFHVRLTKN